MRSGGCPATSPSSMRRPLTSEDVRQDAAEAQAVVVEGLVLWTRLPFRLRSATRVRGPCHPTARASCVATNPLFHPCRRHYPGATRRCSRRSLPNRCQPSPLFARVGFPLYRFEARSAFNPVPARVVAEPPTTAHCRRSASDDVVASIVRSDCYRLERQLPGGTNAGRAASGRRRQVERRIRSSRADPTGKRTERNPPKRPACHPTGPPSRSRIPTPPHPQVLHYPRHRRTHSPPAPPK